MSNNTFENELARAFARPDVEDLKRIVTVYHEWSCRSDPKDDAWPDELEFWFGSSEEDPDIGLALIMIAAATYDEPDFLAVVSAGLLEDLVDSADDEFLDRVLAEARKTPRFMWLLSGVWTMSAKPHHASAIKKLVGGRSCDDPLPPRTWA